MKKLIKDHIDNRETFDEKLSLYFNCNVKRVDVVNFLKNACSFRRGEIRRLTIVGMGLLADEEMALLEGFLRYCLPETMGCVTINFARYKGGISEGMKEAIKA